MRRVFICYRRDDSAGAAGRIYDRLVARYQKRNVFRDIDNIGPGEDWRHAIELTVAKCDVMVAVIGRNWLAPAAPAVGTRLDVPDDFVRLELSIAIERGITIIPTLVDGAALPTQDELPQELWPILRRHAIHLREPGFDEDAERLMRAISKATSRDRKRSQGVKKFFGGAAHTTKRWLTVSFHAVLGSTTTVFRATGLHWKLSAMVVIVLLIALVLLHPLPVTLRFWNNTKTSVKSVRPADANLVKDGGDHGRGVTNLKAGETRLSATAPPPPVAGKAHVPQPSRGGSLPPIHAPEVSTAESAKPEYRASDVKAHDSGDPHVHSRATVESTTGRQPTTQDASVAAPAPQLQAESALPSKSSGANRSGKEKTECNWSHTEESVLTYNGTKLKLPPTDEQYLIFTIVTDFTHCELTVTALENAGLSPKMNRDDAATDCTITLRANQSACPSTEATVRKLGLGYHTTFVSEHNTRIVLPP